MTEALDRGLIDFGLVFENVDLTQYESLQIPYKDIWGVVMRRDAPLAEKKTITAEDLMDKPLILSRQAFHNLEFKELFHCNQEKLNIVATYNLIYNGALMAAEGMGYAITLDKLINTSGDSALCFRPLEPKIEAGITVIWKRHQVLAKAAQVFLQKLRWKG